MAIVTCPACGAAVREHDRTCYTCGHTLPDSTADPGPADLAKSAAATRADGTSTHQA
jgi:hypothetical protein